MPRMCTDVDAVFENGVTSVVVALGGKTADVGETMLTDGTANIIKVCMYALYVCLICMYALYVCLICMPYMYVCLIRHCQHYQGMYVCLIHIRHTYKAYI